MSPNTSYQGGHLTQRYNLQQTPLLNYCVLFQGIPCSLPLGPALLMRRKLSWLASKPTLQWPTLFVSRWSYFLHVPFVTDITLSLPLLSTYRMVAGHSMSTSILSATTSMCLVGRNKTLSLQLLHSQHLCMISLYNHLKCALWIQCKLPRNLGVPHTFHDVFFQSP